MGRDFNAGRFKTAIPLFYQQVSFKKNIELKQEVPVMRSIRKWSDEADARLQYCFASTDCDIFWDSSDNIKAFNTTVPTVTIRTYPNQKPQITGNIHAGLKARPTAYNERDKD